MRIRLVHTQSFLLLTAVLLAVLCMGALNAWNLRNGFSEFLAARDIERLEQFSSFVAQHAERSGGIDGLKAQGLDLSELLRRFARAQGLLPDRPPPTMGASREWEARQIPRPPPSDRAGAFRERVALYRSNGEPLFEKSIALDPSLYVERPVRIRGEVVAVVRMLKLKSTPDQIETSFLKSQYMDIALVAAALLFVAWVCAWWISNRWIRPLLEIQIATNKISAGNFDVRLNHTRTDEIGDVMQNVNLMAGGLQKLEKARRQWIADISHELRTPLSVLRGEIDALAEGVRPLKPEAVLSLREDVMQLISLVDDLHLLAMSDLNALPCYFEECDAQEILEKVVSQFSLRAKGIGLTIKLETSQATAGIVCWDRKRMLQLLANLLDNSFRYTDVPGTIVVRLSADNQEVLIEIDDSAPGVLTQDLARIFDPLFRADIARSRHTGGSGLGLAICNAIVSAHGGTIEAGDSPLGGLQTHIRLPRFVETRA